MVKLELDYTDRFQFVELTRRRKLYKNNQQAGSFITRQLAFLYACKCHFSSVAYKNFLGYDRGENGEFVIIAEEPLMQEYSTFTKDFLEDFLPIK